MVKAAIANWLWMIGSAPAALKFERALEDPAREQESILRRYLSRNSDTAFGKAHGFEDLRNYEQFVRRVPICDYEDVLPWIDRIQRGEARVLTSEPVTRLVPTGGSTSGRKLIPYTSSLQQEFNAAIGPWIVDLYRRHPQASLGPAYWSVTPLVRHAFESPAESAVPIGFDDDSAYLGGWREQLVAAALALTPGLQQIESFDTLRYATLLLLSRTRDLALISVWHPSFLSLMLDAMWRELPRLIQDVARGTCAVIEELPPSIASAVRGPPQPARAREIDMAKNAAEIWPSLRLISCWCDGHAAPSAGALSAILPGVAIQPKGLLATEGVVTIPFADRHPLAIRSHFFEFVEKSGDIRLAHELRIGATYEIILTTSGGLWRYRLGDLVQVDAMVRGTPSLRFLGKTGLVSDRVGEKLSEGFVTTVLAQLFCEHPPYPAFSLLAPDIDPDGSCRYTLYVSAASLPLSATLRLDELLSTNPQYAYSRRIGQLAPPRVMHVTGDAYSKVAARLVQNGQRLGEIKPASLSALDGWSKHFELHS